MSEEAKIAETQETVKIEKDESGDVKSSVDDSTKGSENPAAGDAKESESVVPKSKTPEATQADQQVESVPANYPLAKHPLQYTWTMWFCKNDRQKQWEDCLKEVISFNTVEDFWALYNHIQLPSGLPNQSDYYLFKDKIKPMWEAEGNLGGGRWLVKVDKTMRQQVLDTHWLDLLMAMIGEQFEDLGQYICGAVVNVRNKGDKVSLWTRDANKIEENRRIGEILKNKLGITETLYYEAHDDAKKKQNSIVKHKLYV